MSQIILQADRAKATKNKVRYNWRGYKGKETLYVPKELLLKHFDGYPESVTIKVNKEKEYDGQ